MIQREITSFVIEALQDTPIVFLQGARQVGKSTLAQTIAAHEHPADYLTFDDATTFTLAQRDPAGFLTRLRGNNVILDEVQRVPELFFALKAEVDRDRRAGRFLITGSANALLLPRLADAFVGRMELVTMYPLAQTEIESHPSHLIQSAFRNELPAAKRIACDRADVIQRALRGGYPEVLTRTTERRQRAWFEAYVTTLIKRDVRELSNIKAASELLLLLELLAARAPATLNSADLARAAKIPLTTLNRYLAVLQALFIIQPLAPWSSALTSRLVKAPKILFTDSGLLAHLAHFSSAQIESLSPYVGMLLENFVAMELFKLASWDDERPQLFHFRTHDHKEVDLLLQNRAGKLVGIEVKASSTVYPNDFKGLQALSDLTGSQFACGVVLYTGETIVPFGKRLYAAPIATLWNRF